MIFRVTFYEHPPDGGRKIRRLVRKEIEGDGIVYALAWALAAARNTSDRPLLSRICQVRIEPVEPDAPIQPEQVRFAEVSP